MKRNLTSFSYHQVAATGCQSVKVTSAMKASVHLRLTAQGHKSPLALSILLHVVFVLDTPIHSNSERNFQSIH
jgi:hypothetical protein